MRIEELGRSVVFLTRENQELREQNEIFRQMVVSPLFSTLVWRLWVVHHTDAGAMLVWFSSPCSRGKPGQGKSLSLSPVLFSERVEGKHLCAPSVTPRTAERQEEHRLRALRSFGIAL